VSTAIGPGGKTIELPPIFTGEAKKINFFGLNNTTETKNFFNQPPSTTSNPFQTSSSNNIFRASAEKVGPFNQQNQASDASTEKVGLFSQQNQVGDAGTLFNKGSNNLFGGSVLFGANQSTSILTAGDNVFLAKGEEDEEGEEENEDGLIEAEDDANPSLSTGKYDYVQTQVHFKESANKFREGGKDTLDNITISI
jgi:hypothetical protein